MKKIVLPVLFVTCIWLVFSCHKDSKVIPADYYFKASRNTLDWGATATTSIIPGDSIMFTAIRQSSAEQMNINIKFNGVGKYALAGGQASLLATGSDGITTSFRLDTTLGDTLIVKSYSTSTHIAQGSFKIHFLKVSSDPNEYVPVFFDNGLFRVKMPE